MGFVLSLVGWMMFSSRVGMQNEKFRPLGMESRIKAAGCDFFGKRGI